MTIPQLLEEIHWKLNALTTEAQFNAAKVKLQLLDDHLYALLEGEDHEDA